MSESIEVQITEDGTVQVSVNGCAGPSCKDLTRQLEQALGSTTETQKTADYARQGQSQRSVKR